MTREFSFYEFTGILVPGATLLLGLAIPLSELRELFTGDEFDASQLGLFLIGCYVAGHLVQAIGNVIEYVLWIKRRMPTFWIRRPHPPYLSDAQAARMGEVFEKLTGKPVGPLASLDDRTCRGLVGQLYARLDKEGRTQRIDIFNGNYGLFRGMAASLLVVLCITVITSGLLTWQTLFVGTLFGLAIARMHRFGVHYASEIYRQALNLPWT